MKVVAGEPEVVLVLERCGETTIREARQQRKEEGGSMRRSAGSRRSDVPADLQE